MLIHFACVTDVPDGRIPEKHELDSGVLSHCCAVHPGICRQDLLGIHLKLRAEPGPARSSSGSTRAAVTHRHDFVRFYFHVGLFACFHVRGTYDRIADAALMSKQGKPNRAFVAGLPACAMATGVPSSTVFDSLFAELGLVNMPPVGTTIHVFKHEHTSKPAEEGGPPRVRSSTLALKAGVAPAREEYLPGQHPMSRANSVGFCSFGSWSGFHGWWFAEGQELQVSFHYNGNASPPPDDDWPSCPAVLQKNCTCLAASLFHSFC